MRTITALLVVMGYSSITWAQPYSDASLDDVWIVKDVGLYFVFDGQGNIPTTAIFRSDGGTYSVASNGTLEMDLPDDDLTTTGTMTSSTTADVTFFTQSDEFGPFVMEKADMAVASGVWSGTLTDDDNTDKVVSFTVDENGNVSSFTGDLTGPVTGKFYILDGYLVAKFFTGDPLPWKEGRITGDVILDALSGTLELDCSCPDGVANLSFDPAVVTNTYSGQENQVFVYPTVTESNIYIENLEGSYSVKIIDQLGTVQKNINATNTNMIPLTDVSPGIYFVKLYSEDVSLTTKVIKR